MPDPVSNPASDWLLARFDDTDPGYIQVYDEDADEYLRPDYLQPMFELKSDIELGTAMRVIRADYDDRHRWWL
jgi:hypothetical protein